MKFLKFLFPVSSVVLVTCVIFEFHTMVLVLLPITILSMPLWILITKREEEKDGV